MTILTRYPDADGFFVAAGEALYADEALHNLQIGIVERLTGDMNFYGEVYPYLAVVSDQGAPVLTGTMTPPFGLVLAALIGDATEAIPLLVCDLLESNWQLPDVHGETRYARLFAQEWAAQTGGSLKKRWTSALTCCAR